MNTAIVAVCFVATVIAASRWLRVAQREHYLAGSVTRFARRWWSAGQLNQVLVLALVAAMLSSFSVPWMALAAAVVIVTAPVGLTLKGRTSKLSWTRRLKTLAIVAAVIDAGLFVLSALTDRGPALAAALCFLPPVVIDLALAITAPFERRAARAHVRSATARLRAVRPVTIAITGSYGKTSTKQYVRHLLAGHRSVLASPASFNNTNGLSRTLNDHLTPGTDVFIAEMGTYGPGEIRAMCSWVQPSIAAIVNIGPVHLERMRSLDGVVAAKSEIAASASTIVLNVSAHGLAQLADRLESAGQRVVRVATDVVGPGADRAIDVIVHRDGDELVVTAGDTTVARVVSAAQPANVAAALGLVLAVGLTLDDVAPRLSTLPQPEHRQEVQRSDAGVVVIDNTFSSNPASARSSLDLLHRISGPARRHVVVTPGMVELGPLQFEENRLFAIEVDDVATDLVIVGLTNRRALVAGAARRDVQVHLAGTRDEAVAWVRATLTDGDTVLYENDLPDHYP